MQTRKVSGINPIFRETGLIHLSIRYCSVTCQTVDLPVHKSFCKAFSALRQNSPPSYPLSNLSDDNGGDASPIGAVERNILVGKLTYEMDLLIKKIGRANMGKISNSLLYLEPRCLWCYRTKAHLSAEGNKSAHLLHCPLCLGATYCCSDHQQKAEASHTFRDGEDSLTQVGAIEFYYFYHSESLLSLV